MKAKQILQEQSFFELLENRIKILVQTLFHELLINLVKK